MTSEVYFKWAEKYASLAAPKGMCFSGTMHFVKVERDKATPMAISHLGSAYNYCVTVTISESGSHVEALLYFGSSFNPVTRCDSCLINLAEDTIAVLAKGPGISASFRQLKTAPTNIPTHRKGLISEDDIVDGDVLLWNEVPCYFESEEDPLLNLRTMYLETIINQHNDLHPLLDYFNGISIADVVNVSLRDAIDMVEPKHRFKIRKLWKQYVLPHQGKRRSAPNMELVEFLKGQVYNGVLTLTDRVSSVTLQHPDRKVSFRSLSQAVENTNEGKHKILGSSETIRILCEDTCIQDDDLEGVASFAASLGGKEVVEEMNLSWNLIGLGDMDSTVLLEMISKVADECKRLVLVGNPVATIDYRELWLAMDIPLLSRIVWITRSSYRSERGKWRDCTNDRSLEAVITIHNAYYGIAGKQGQDTS